MRRTTVTAAAALVSGAMLTAAFGAAHATSATAESTSAPVLDRLGTYNTRLGVASAEIAALDDDKMFVINGDDNSIDIVDVTDPGSPVRLKRISLAAYGAAPNSVAATNGLVAIAVEASPMTSPGRVVFMNYGGKIMSSAQVGALPDMLTFTPDGSSVVVANEGEPSGYEPGDIDPEGSVSIVSVRPRGSKNPSVRTVGFGTLTAAQLTGVRLNGPAATHAQDLEPEYVTVSADSRTAWVTLQENNAIATIDLAEARVTGVSALGSKDHAATGAGLDPSDRDGAIAIASWPVRGLYMPDAIASFEAGGRRLVMTANEGDARDYDGFADEERVSGLTLDENSFGGAVAVDALRSSGALGRLTVSSTDGLGEDGEYESLYAFGGRSFSIWDADTGEQVFDSGDALEQVTAAVAPTAFNAGNEDNTFDSRSDNKGPEPEGVAVGELGGRTYAFVGLERVGGFVVFDVTDPEAATFVQWVNNRDYTSPVFGPDGGPEGLSFVPAAHVAAGIPLVVVSHEITGTVSLYSPTS